MNITSVRSEKDAILYLTDCLLATVSDMAMKKSRRKWEYERHIEIAQTAINWIADFGISVESNTRAHEIFTKHSRSVSGWAKQYEA